jgi:coenzyme F420-dependent glucose-6-phosphate dehydrogenase
VAKVIAPYREAATKAGKGHLVLATRWTVLADGPDEAWQALSSMRGLRAPGRLEATDPQELRIKADDMDRDELLASYAVIPDAAGLINAYRPLVTDVGADIVSIQVMSADPMAAIELIGKEVLPELRKLAAWSGSGQLARGLG